MVLRQIRLGANPDILQYDDADYDAAIETSESIKAGPPVDPTDVLRLADIGVVIGDVSGPAASVDNDIVLFDGVTGKLIKDSGILIADLTEVSYNEVIVPVAATSLTIGIELSEVFIEYVRISAVGAEVLTRFLGGVAGQVKVLIFNGGNVSLTDGTRDSGKFYLNQLPALTDFTGATGDILALINIDGDGGATTHGWWEELHRSVKVK